MGKSARLGGGFLLLLSALALGYTYWDELQGARETLQLTYAHRSLSAARDAPVKGVTVFRNGYSTGGVQMQLSAELLAARTGDGELAAYLSQFVAVEGLHESVYHGSDASNAKEKDHGELETPGVVADRVFNGQGELLQAYADILSGDRLYLVAPGLLFVWPFVELGHRVAVTSTASPTSSPVVIESISESPRTFRLHNFFDDEEADRLIQRTLEIDDPGSKLQQSHVGHNSGKKQVSKHRTSENAFDTISETAIAIRKRVFDVLSLGEYTEDMCDGLQLLRYQQKQAYIAHEDYFPVNVTPAFNFDPHTGGSNRFATVFLYLSNVTRGGQTVFPLAEMPEGLPAEYDHPVNSARDYEAAGAELFEPGSWEMDMVRKCSTKLASYPRKGDAVLFYSQKPNGQLDPLSLHGGCPVLDGTKWGANLWVWNKRRYGLDGDPNGPEIKFSVVFENPTSREVGVYWSSTLMTTLAANGGSIVYTTYTGHKWTVKDGDRVVLEFMGDAEDGGRQTVVVLTPEEQLIAHAKAQSAKDEL
ncbi:hypothetical protein BBJ28_00024573 [Nothophytophthora sp. Chile5]|nr:hypothetical protein BBJ28_00024573 [Nothophytophthora sp. Chile5]